MSLRHSGSSLIGGTQHLFSDRSSAIHFAQHEFLQGISVGLVLLLHMYVCISACAHMHLCVWVPVSIASDPNQSWSLVTVLQQGDLRFDGADKHMMWLYISKVSTTCTHHAKSMSLLSLDLSSPGKITIVLSCTCFDMNRVLKTDANSFVVQLLSVRLYYRSQERISIFIAILRISPILTSLYF